MPYRKAITRSIGLGLLLLGTAGGAIAAQSLPDLIYMTSGPRIEPVWVSAEEARDPETGGLRVELFSESDRDQFRRFAADVRRLQKEAGARGAGRQGCLLSLASGCEERMDPKPNRSLPDLAGQAIAIYRGRIGGIAQGFFGGVPSSLLRVEITQAFRQSDQVAKEVVWVPHPQARFQMGDLTVCGGAKGYEPAEGDQVLVFVYDPPVDADHALVVPRGPEIFFQTAAGRLIVPDLLKKDREIGTAGSLDDLEKLLRRKVN